MRDGRCVAYCGWLSAAAVGTLRSARANAHRTSALRARILGAGTHLPVRWTKTFTARTSSRFFAIRLAHISGVGWSLGRLGAKHTRQSSPPERRNTSSFRYSRARCRHPPCSTSFGLPDPGAKIPTLVGRELAIVIPRKQPAASSAKET